MLLQRGIVHTYPDGRCPEGPLERLSRLAQREVIAKRSGERMHTGRQRLDAVKGLPRRAAPDDHVAVGQGNAACPIAALLAKPRALAASRASVAKLSGTS
jgi:hypothetical protein